MGSDGESSPARVPSRRPTSSSVSPGALGALAVVVAAVAVGAFGLTSEATLGIDLGTTYSVAATCEGNGATSSPPARRSVSRGRRAPRAVTVLGRALLPRGRGRRPLGGADELVLVGAEAEEEATPPTTRRCTTPSV